MLVLVMLDSASIVGALFLAMLLRLEKFTFISKTHFWIALALYVPVMLFSLERLNVYKSVLRYMPIKSFLDIFVASLITAFTLMIISIFWELSIPRSIPFIFIILSFMIIAGSRLTLQGLLVVGSHNSEKEGIIYGAGESGRQLLNAINSNKQFKVICFIDDNIIIQNSKMNGLSVVSFEKAKSIIESRDIQTVFLAMPSVLVSQRQIVLKKLAEIPIEVRTLPSLSDLIEGKVELSGLKKVSVEDLLGRPVVPPIPELMSKTISGKVVLVTGAGGSIGNELAKEILQQSPTKLLLCDISEFALYRVLQDLKLVSSVRSGNTELVPIIGSIQDKELVDRVFKSNKIDTIYHAAAYKHVHLVEANIIEGLKNNIFGTAVVAKAAIDFQVDNFILISSDKAVRPTNFMGASKRLAELVCQSLAISNPHTKISMVRFGNVMASSGSVIPLFEKQIKEGGPVTVTDRNVTRYFMTKLEAAQLVIQSAAMAKGGDVFVLEMGEPVRIYDLAFDMIRLKGLLPYIIGADNTPQGDIGISITGLRSGEKLYEEKFIGKNVTPTMHPRISSSNEDIVSKSKLENILKNLERAMESNDTNSIAKILKIAPIGFNHSKSIHNKS